MFSPREAEEHVSETELAEATAYATRWHRIVPTRDTLIVIVAKAKQVHKDVPCPTQASVDAVSFYEAGRSRPLDAGRREAYLQSTVHLLKLAAA